MDRTELSTVECFEEIKRAFEKEENPNLVFAAQILLSVREFVRDAGSDTPIEKMSVFDIIDTVKRMGRGL